MGTTLTILEATSSDRENMVVELWSGEDHVAEVSDEPGQGIEVEIFPARSGQPWQFSLTELQRALRRPDEFSRLRETPVRLSHRQVKCAAYAMPHAAMEVH